MKLVLIWRPVNADIHILKADRTLCSARHIITCHLIRHFHWPVQCHSVALSPWQLECCELWKGTSMKLGASRFIVYSKWAEDQNLPHYKSIGSGPNVQETPAKMCHEFYRKTKKQTTNVDTQQMLSAGKQPLDTKLQTTCTHVPWVKAATGNSGTGGVTKCMATACARWAYTHTPYY